MDCILERYKKLAELNSIIIKTEKVNGNLIFNRYYNENEVQISINAIAWKFTDWENYKIYRSEITIPKEKIKNYGKQRIKTELLTLLYKKVMENNNIML